MPESQERGLRRGSTSQPEGDRWKGRRSDRHPIVALLAGVTIGLIAISCGDPSPTETTVPSFRRVFATLDTVCTRSDVDCSPLTAAQEDFIQNIIWMVNPSSWHCVDIADSLQAYLDSGRIYTYPHEQLGDTAGWVDPENWTMGLDSAVFYMPNAVEQIVIHEGDHANRHGHDGAMGWATTHPPAVFADIHQTCIDF